MPPNYTRRPAPPGPNWIITPGEVELAFSILCNQLERSHMFARPENESDEYSGILSTVNFSAGNTGCQTR